MDVCEELRHEHDVLRRDLEELEEQLPAVPLTRPVVSCLTESLALHLRSHVEKEERLLVAHPSRYEPSRPDVMEHSHDDHDNQRIHLAVLHELLTLEGPEPDRQLVTEASEFIKELREHLTMEETEIFPAAEALIPLSRRCHLDETTVQYLGLA